VVADTGMACPYACLLVKASDLVGEFSSFCCMFLGVDTGGDTGTTCLYAYSLNTLELFLVSAGV
jgi:hypothetical protein